MSFTTFINIHISFFIIVKWTSDSSDYLSYDPFLVSFWYGIMSLGKLSMNYYLWIMVL